MKIKIQKLWILSYLALGEWYIYFFHYIWLCPWCRYCFIVTILAFVYSAFQLFKGICDIAHKGILISDIISDYTSFILDQVVVRNNFLLLFSSSHLLVENILWQSLTNIVIRISTVGGLPSSFIFFSSCGCYTRDWRILPTVESNYYLCQYFLGKFPCHCNLCSLFRLQAL